MPALYTHRGLRGVLRVVVVGRRVPAVVARGVHKAVRELKLRPRVGNLRQTAKLPPRPKRGEELTWQLRVRRKIRRMQQLGGGREVP